MAFLSTAGPALESASSSRRRFRSDRPGQPAVDAYVLPCYVTRWDGGAGEQSDLHLRLEDRGVPHLLLRRAPVLTALLPDTPEALQAFREEVGPAFPTGLSDPIGGVSRVPDACREAQWALQGAKAAAKPVARYGEGSAHSPFMPRSLSESQRVVEHVLGPVIDYDATHGSRLLASLQTWLSHDRSWQKAAGALQVHRQTLVYRMHRVE